MGSRILIIDDDRAIRRILEVNLRVRGYVVDAAGTGAEGLALARCQPDLVILDLGLPDLPGTAVISEIRASSAVPIVVISSQGIGPAEAAARDAGADDYLCKPFPIGRLVARVQAALRTEPARLLGVELRQAAQ
jgi:two-component system, OmpR family, KDP operon response regulator KdpE